MTITYRDQLSRDLTPAEVDANFRHVLEIENSSDYEAGNWTPVLSFGGAITGITYASRSGTYTRLGRIVIAPYTLALSNKGSATGSAVIGGLPFSVLATGTPHAIYWAGMTTSVVTVVGLLSVTDIGLFGATAAAASIGLLDEGDLSNSTSLIGVAIYHTA